MGVGAGGGGVGLSVAGTGDAGATVGVGVAIGVGATVGAGVVKAVGEGVTVGSGVDVGLGMMGDGLGGAVAVGPRVTLTGGSGAVVRGVGGGGVAAMVVPWSAGARVGEGVPPPAQLEASSPEPKLANMRIVSRPKMTPGELHATSRLVYDLTAWMDWPLLESSRSVRFDRRRGGK